MKNTLASIFNQNGECFVLSSLGVKIKILEVGWKLISEIKHQELKGKLSDVCESIKNPDIVDITTVMDF